MTDSGDSTDHRPLPKDLSHHLSRSTRTRAPNAIKAFYKYFQIPGIGQLAGGLPSNDYFPFDTLEAKIARPDRFKPTGNRPVDPPCAAEDPASTVQALSELSLADPKHISNNPPKRSLLPSLSSRSSSNTVPQDSLLVPHTAPHPNPLLRLDLSTALQYGTAQGYPPLYYFLRQFTREHFHPNCPYRGGPEIILTVGNTDGMAKTLLALSNEWHESKDWVRDREGMLCEEFAYMGAIQTALPRGLNVVKVGVDEEGMRSRGAGGLRDVLANWDTSRGKRPHLLYTVTVGQNPTSGVLSIARRKEILAICNEYDVIIIEDDPYWYLQYPSATAHNTLTTFDASNTSFSPTQHMFANGEALPEEEEKRGWKSTGYPFLDSIVPSYINFDTEGRVIRLDTFSKTVAPGCRLGWITAQPALIERLLRITETSTQQPSGFVQSLVAELLIGPPAVEKDGGVALAREGPAGRGGGKDGAGWKPDGWVRWLEGLRGNYERRMTLMSAILAQGREFVVEERETEPQQQSVTSRGPCKQRSASTSSWSALRKFPLYTFHHPQGGMFIWLQVHLEAHPLFGTAVAQLGPLAGPATLSHALWVFWTGAPHRVLVAPGAMFAADAQVREEQSWKFFRVCFAAIEEAELAPVSQRLVAGVRAFWEEVKEWRDVEELVDEDRAEEAEGLVRLGGIC